MQEKKKGFRVKIEDISNIYEQIKKPTPFISLFDVSMPQMLGEAALSPPLKNVRLFYESTGKHLRFDAHIFIDTFLKDGKPYYYPIGLPIKILKKQFSYIVCPRNTVARIYSSKESEDPRFIVVKKDEQIIISAGRADIESAPPIPITSEENLRADLVLLARIIETIVRSVYLYYSIPRKVITNTGETEIKSILEPDTTLYIRAPIGYRKVDDDDEDYPDIKLAANLHKKELKTAIHRINPDDIKETLDDVQGVDEAKEEIIEVIDILKNPEKYKKMGVRVLRGILLVGPPGTGKTMLAKATAKEANVPFFSASGSEFVEIFVGQGAGRIRKLFEEARKNTPCIIFIDELDALGRSRSGGRGGSSEYDQTLSQLLVELDGFEKNKGILVMAATNAPELLDPGIMRPGRFDRQITLDLPDVAGREAILRVHSKNKPLAEDVDFKKVAFSTPSFSGADLESIMNEAGWLAIREHKDKISMKHIQMARDKVRMGPERKTRIIDEEKLKIAYHEMGHAIVRTFLYPDTDPVEMVTIKPRGSNLGVVMSLPEEDFRLSYKNKLEAQLISSLGGRAAEEIIFGKNNYSTGASEDMRNSTDLARRMVTEWGMGRKTGLATLGRNLRWKFLGGFNQGTEGCSEKTNRMIDDEIRRILKKKYKKAKKILKNNKTKLHELAQILVKRETMSGEELRKYLGRS